MRSAKTITLRKLQLPKLWAASNRQATFFKKESNMRSNYAISLLLAAMLVSLSIFAQEENVRLGRGKLPFNEGYFSEWQWRNIGPYRGGRCVAVCGVANQPFTYYMGSTGGGVWKTEDAGQTWANISDGYFSVGSIGAIAVAPSDPNVIYVGTGEHAVRGVMTTHGDGVYRSTDAGETWDYIGLPFSEHIARIIVHPEDPQRVYVAVQGTLYQPSQHRGIYYSEDGGKTWDQKLYISATTGASDLSINPQNPRIMYAAMWDHKRTPWNIRSGGPGSGLYRSTDGGNNWEKLGQGLPEAMGKTSIAVSPADPKRVYANIEAANGGVFVSRDGGNTWMQTTNHRTTIARAWYYIKVVPSPIDPETIFILNAPLLRSIDGGRTFEQISTPHTDQHALWINPQNPDFMVLGNDGGATISINGGKTWSSQMNQPTAQVYRINADHRYPYYVYGSQQDNTSFAIANRTDNTAIGSKDWYLISGSESGFIALDPYDPRYVFSTGYQGNVTVFDQQTGSLKDVMACPNLGLAKAPKEQRYRFNWNAPIVTDPHHPEVVYHGAQVVLKTNDRGMHWVPISPDLTRDQEDRQGPGGGPYTNEGAGGENYNTISYLACSPHRAGEIWAGTDDGLLHLTHNGGEDWLNLSLPIDEEGIVNCVEVSPHQPGTAFVAVTRYKFGDKAPYLFRTTDYGKTWKRIVHNLPNNEYVMAVREDPVRPGLLFAGTVSGVYVSLDQGENWHSFQLNLPACPVTDIKVHENDLLLSTAGRAIWILDDISALQQIGEALPGQQAFLYQPDPVVRRVASGIETTVIGMGENPAVGLTIDYFLPPKFVDQLVSLDILTADGQLVRSYTSEPDSSFVRYDGGPKPQPPLSTKRGVNRFSWDLRRQPLPGVTNTYILGRYQAGTVPPGAYTLRLYVSGDTLETQTEVLPDPRLDLPASVYHEQAVFLQRIEHAIRDMHQAVNQMRDVREQIRHIIPFLEKSKKEHQELIQKGRKVMECIDHWELALVQPKQETAQDVINYPNQLSAEFMDLKRRVDTQDPRLTEGVKQRYRQLEAEWQTHKAKMQSIREGEIAQFNRIFREKDLPALIIPMATAF